MAEISGQIIVGCWVAFIAYWFISASRVKATAEQQGWQSSLAHRFPVGLGCWLLAYRGFPPPLNRMVTPHTDWSQAVGALVCMAGLFVTIWARRTLAGNWSGDVTFKQGHELVKAGPYRFVRHPIYTGLLMMCIGSALESGRLRSWLGVVCVAVGFWIKLKQEEKLMLRHFPNDYPAYREQVKALVPFVI